MVLPHGSGDLYHKYRPRKFNEIAGHPEVVTSIKKALTSSNPAHSFLLIGSSGTGKTTTARIMALALNCLKPDGEGEPCLSCKACKAILTGRCSDIIEVNAADNRGIGDIRALCKTMPLMPLQLKRKVFILDEAHQLTNDAQSSILKELEEAPSHVFIILCSTHPKKILSTVKNRCQRFQFSPLKRKDMMGLLEEVASYEGEVFSKEVYNAVTNAADGSPRNGLVKLQQVIQLGDKNLPAIMRLLSDEAQQDPSAIKICFTLNSKSRAPKWSELSNLLTECRHLGAPAIGMIVAGYFRNQLLKATDKASADARSDILELFVVPFAEGKLGENQLTLNLYKAYVIIGAAHASLGNRRNSR